MTASTSDTSATNALSPAKSNIVELKNGKVVFKQKPVSFEKHSETMQAIVSFRERLEQMIEKKEPPLSEFPEEYRPLIAKLAHESDKSLTALAKYLAQELAPLPQDDDDQTGSSMPKILPPSVLETAISSTLSRNNYGLDVFPIGTKVPASLCAWRWEVKPEYRDWLPKSAREKAEARLLERVEAKKYLLWLFDSLPQVERDKFLNLKGIKNSLTNSTPRTEESPAKTPATKVVNEETDTPSGSPGPSEKGKKAGDTPKEVKTKAREGKKAVLTEKEKKEQDAQNKSRSLMANFFGIGKGSKAASSSKVLASGQAGPSTSVSEFNRTFKPFVLKKDAHLAPINWFTCKGTQSLPPDVILIDIDDTEPHAVGAMAPEIVDSEPEHNLDAMNTEERLRSVIASLTRHKGARRRRRSPNDVTQWKTFHPHVVRDIMSQLSEAEVSGDDSLVRILLAQLRNRDLIPAKALIFADDVRPGYFGTWTRNSRIIGPRAPLAKDMLVLDYSYDSGEEWEEENPGDADDVNDDGDDDEDAESVDSDLESWLVDDDEELPALSEERAPSPLIPDLPLITPANKRKAEPGERKLAKKRKVVVPLVPFSRGPCWERTIGHCEFAVLKPYRIQLFNDTPFPIDPFTFVSTVLEDSTAPTHGATSEATGISTGESASATNSSMPPPPVTKRGPPKTVFPDALLPVLLTKISTLQAFSLPYLVEKIRSDLQEHDLKKNAIELKVREVGVKCKQKKFWVVKPAFMAVQGSSSPSASS